MKPTPEQRVAIETQDRALVVTAGAGTGKTWVLVQRFVHLLQAHPDWSLESIIAITFTEKAAREMRTRLRYAIETLAREYPKDLLWQNHRLNVDRLQVSTIHSLCAHILRENSIAAGIDPGFQVLDEQEADLLKEQAIQATIKSLEEEDHPALELLTSLRIYDLRSEMESMLSKRGTLVQLFRDLDHPERLLDRWRVGLAEMLKGVWDTQLHDQPRLLIALEVLPEITISNPQDLLAESVLIAQQGCQLYKLGDLRATASSWLPISLRGGTQDSWGGKEALVELKDLLGTLRSAAKALEKSGALQEIGLQDEIAAQHLQLWRSLWDRLELTYRQIKESQQALDFDDLELLTDRLVTQEPRPARLQKSLGGIHHLMVDEFQDTNLLQQRIVYALAPVESPGKLFVVGDAKQSIYRFRQAQVGIFNRTAADIKEVTGKAPQPLSTSFRTHQSLVQACNYLFEELFQPSGLVPVEFEASPGPLSAQRAAHPELPCPIEMLLLPAKDPQDKKVSAEDARLLEAQWLAQRLLQLKQDAFLVWDKDVERYRPFEYRDAAVLFRATTNLPLYEGVFKDAGLPYLTVSGRGYYDRQEVQDLISLLAALADPCDDLYLAASLRSPLFSLNDETLYQLRWYSPTGEHSPEPIPLRAALAQPPQTAQAEFVTRASQILESLWALASRVEVWSLLRAALDATAYEATLALNDGDTGRQRANINKFMALARERGGVSITSFLSRIRELKAREAREGEALGREPESGAVQLMSIHAAKGLEFPVLIVADLGRRKGGGFGTPYLLHDPTFGLVCKVRDENGDWQKPASYAWGEWLNGRMEEAESKRLFYVACTRAADLLILSGQVSNRGSWLQDALKVWWIPVEGPEQETLTYEGFAIQVFRPIEMIESQPVINQKFPQPVSINQIPFLAEPVPESAQLITISVTQMEQLMARGTDLAVQLQPGLRATQRSAESPRAPAYLVGEIVHRALAQWDCLTYSEVELFHWLESCAMRLGVFPTALTHAVNTAYSMLQNLITNPLFGTLQRAKVRYHELPFSLASPMGTLHGVIDLLIQDSSGNWHLMDWKTEWTSHDQLPINAQEHLIQMAVYARASYHRLGVHPEVSICFLSPRLVMYPCSVEELEVAWLEITGQVGNTS